MIVSLPIFSVEEASQQKHRGDEDWFVLFNSWKISLIGKRLMRYVLVLM